MERSLGDAVTLVVLPMSRPQSDNVNVTLSGAVVPCPLSAQSGHP